MSYVEIFLRLSDLLELNVIHQDEFEIAYSDYRNQNVNTATSIAYTAPSLTPRSKATKDISDRIGIKTEQWLGANPAFRVYDVDPDTYEIMDSRTLIGGSPFVVRLEYFLIKFLSLADMSDSSFQSSRKAFNIILQSSKLDLTR